MWAVYSKEFALWKFLLLSKLHVNKVKSLEGHAPNVRIVLQHLVLRFLVLNAQNDSICSYILLLNNRFQTVVTSSTSSHVYFLHLQLLRRNDIFTCSSGETFENCKTVHITDP